MQLDVPKKGAQHAHWAMQPETLDNLTIQASNAGTLALRAQSSEHSKLALLHGVLVERGVNILSSL